MASDLLTNLLPQATSKNDFLAGAGVGQIVSVAAFAFGVFLWVTGFWFLIPPIMSLAHRSHIPFAISWWGLIFPTVRVRYLVLLPAVDRTTFPNPGRLLAPHRPIGQHDKLGAVARARNHIYVDHLCSLRGDSVPHPGDAVRRAGGDDSA